MIRPAEVKDLPQIVEIYSYSVLNSIVTFEEEPPSLIASPQSVAFHERFNFRKVGVLEKVGLKFGGWIDTTLL